MRQGDSPDSFSASAGAVHSSERMSEIAGMLQQTCNELETALRPFLCNGPQLDWSQFSDENPARNDSRVTVAIEALGLSPSEKEQVLVSVEELRVLKETLRDNLTQMHEADQNIETARAIQKRVAETARVLRLIAQGVSQRHLLSENGIVNISPAVGQKRLLTLGDRPGEVGALGPALDAAHPREAQPVVAATEDLPVPGDWDDHSSANLFPGAQSMQEEMSLKGWGEVSRPISSEVVAALAAVARQREAAAAGAPSIEVPTAPSAPEPLARLSGRRGRATPPPEMPAPPRSEPVLPVREVPPPVPPRDSAPEKDDTGRDDFSASPVSRQAKFVERINGARKTMGDTFAQKEAQERAKRGPTFREVLEKKQSNRHRQFMEAGQEVMTKNPVYRRVLRDSEWDDERIQAFTEALGAKKLELDALLLKDVEGGLVFKIPESKVLAAGLKLIRQHEKSLEKIQHGFGKMSTGEIEALEAAMENGDLEPPDVTEYAAMRAGWFAGIGYTARRRELSRLVRPILESVWLAQKQISFPNIRTGREGSVTEHEATITSEEVTGATLNTFTGRYIMTQIRTNKHPGVTVADAETFFSMWGRTSNKGIPSGNDAQKAKEQQALDKMNIVLKKEVKGWRE